VKGKLGVVQVVQAVSTLEKLLCFYAVSQQCTFVALQWQTVINSYLSHKIYFWVQKYKIHRIIWYKRLHTNAAVSARVWFREMAEK